MAQAGSKWSAAGKSGSIPKSKFFQDSITRAAKDKYGSILQGLAKNVKDATKTAEENAECVDRFYL